MALAQKIKEFLLLSTEKKAELKYKLNECIQKHALPVLVEKLALEIK